MNHAQIIERLKARLEQAEARADGWRHAHNNVINGMGRPIHTACTHKLCKALEDKTVDRVTIITIDHPGDWNPHVDTEQGQFTYRLRRIEAHKYDGHAEKITAELRILDTSDTLADVQATAARLINPQGAES